MIEEKPLINPETLPEELMGDAEPTFDVSRKKRRLVRTTIEFKKEIIEKFERGVRVSDLSAEYNMPRSTISTILKKREVIKAADVAKGVKTVTKQRPQVLEDVEKLLLIWVNQRQIEGEPVNKSIITAKAKQLYTDLSRNKPETSEGESFKASRGWYENFKRRSGISKPEGDASATQKSVEKFINDFRDYVTVEGFYPQQVFTCNETELFWKRLPKKTFIAQEESATGGHRPMNDKVTLLLSSNASGDLKLKPLLVYHSETPRAFHKNRISKAELPVMWRSHPKGWVTRVIFTDWMNEVFGPTVTTYLMGNNYPMKALLLLDNAPAHPVDLEDSLLSEFDFITVRFLPPDVTPLLRPIGPNVLAHFKNVYLNLLLQGCSFVTSSTKLTLREYWKNHFNIFHCIHLIVKAWEEMSSTWLNSSWGKLWPEGVFKTEYNILETETARLKEEILNSSHSLDLQVEEDDLEEMQQGSKKDLTTEDLQELQKEQEKMITMDVSSCFEEKKEECPDPLVQDVLAQWETVQNFVLKYHPDKTSTEKLVAKINSKVFGHFRGVLNAKAKN